MEVGYCGDTSAMRGPYCPGPYDTVAHYTQVIVHGRCIIPPEKPAKEKLINKHPSIEIRKAETVDSDEFVCGHQITGKKVVVAGLLHLGIEYSAKTIEQKVHYFQCDIPFQAIILECASGEQRLFPPDFKLSDFVVHVCLEHLQVHQIDERTIEHVAVLMVWLQANTCSHVAC